MQDATGLFKQRSEIRQSWHCAAACGASWMALVLLLLWWRGDWIVLALGPQPRDWPSIVDDGSSTANQLVSIPTDQVDLLFPAAYTIGERPYAYYALVRHGGQGMLALVGQDCRAGELTGWLSGISPFEQEHIFHQVQSKCPDVQLLPMRLDAASPWHTELWLRRLLLLAAGLMGVFQSIRLWRAMRVMHKAHPEAVHAAPYARSMH